MELWLGAIGLGVAFAAIDWFQRRFLSTLVGAVLVVIGSMFVGGGAPGAGLLGLFALYLLPAVILPYLLARGVLWLLTGSISRGAASRSQALETIAEQIVKSRSEQIKRDTGKR